MDFFQFVIISLHITKVLSRRKYSESSEESIENLLYYKDCQHRRSQTTASPNQPLKLVETPPPNPCPFPKMCCSMSCDDQCNSGMNGMSAMSSMAGMMSRQPGMVQPIMPNPTPRQPHFVPPQPGIKMRGRKKTMIPTDLLPPVEARRDFGFTKEKIKGLIAQDGDIRKILKDLVRVTMQKVDLVDKMQAKRHFGDANKAVEHMQVYRGIDDDNDELE